MTIENSGLQSNLFQTMLFGELSQINTLLDPQESPQNTLSPFADNAITQNSELPEMLSAYEGNAGSSNAANYNPTEMEQLLAMEDLLAAEQADADADADDCSGNFSGYGANSGYNTENNAIQNEFQIGNEAILLGMLEQDSQGAQNSPNPKNWGANSLWNARMDGGRA